MDITTDISRLHRLYNLYDDFIKDWETACQKHCDLCCTDHVTMTTLEGHLIVDALQDESGKELISALPSKIDPNRFQPQITTNQMAAFCIEKKEMPEENMPQTRGECPFLDRHHCLIYASRPFGCRCMISVTDCRRSETAEIDPFVLSVNTLLLQYIEHIDHNGLFGNLADVILFLASKKNRRQYQQNRIDKNRTPLVFNRPISGILIPPEHQEKVRPLLFELEKI